MNDVVIFVLSEMKDVFILLPSDMNEVFAEVVPA